MSKVLDDRRKTNVMTESDWLCCDWLFNMLYFLHDQVTNRQLRLFACACVRRRWDDLSSEAFRDAVEVAEEYAEGRATMSALYAAHDDAEWELGNPGNVDEDDPVSSIRFWAEELAVAVADPEFGPDFFAWCRRDAFGPKEEDADRAHLLREVLGNPWRPLTPRDFPAPIRGLAEEIHGGNHDLFGLLADHLEDVGEVEAAAHCRQGGHAKSCHVVAWVLGTHEPVPLGRILDLHESEYREHLEKMLAAKIGRAVDDGLRTDPEFTNRLAAERRCEAMRLLRRFIILPSDPRVRQLVEDINGATYAGRTHPVTELCDLLRAEFPATPKSFLRTLRATAPR
jgi:hypothetical protein